MRRCKNKFFLTCLLSLIFLSSCQLTSSLWNNSYEENFKHFLVSSDGAYIVFLGDHYHYIFVDDSGAIKQLLSWPRRDLIFINAEKTNLKVDRNNNITGHVLIESFYTKLPRKEFAFLQSLGFRGSQDEAMTLNLKLRGKRYLPRDDLGEKLPSLNQSYIISVSQERGIFGVVKNAALTPITITLDATLLIGKTILLPFRGN